MNHAVGEDWKQKTSRSSHPFLIIPEVFGPDECREIISLFGGYPAAPGMSWNRDSGYGVNPDTRQVATAYIPRQPKTLWVYQRMDEIFFKTASYWGLDVRETVEDVKYLVYRESDHFSQWHIDIGEDRGSRRKLSMSIELCDSSEYEGGELQIFPSDKGHVAGPYRPAGVAIVFPSHRYHRVMPITRGTRYALVNWISGPPLR
jgi:PKHD-type hydroxylase